MPLFTNVEIEKEWSLESLLGSVHFVAYLTDLWSENLSESHQNLEQERVRPLYGWENQLRNKLAQIQSSVNLGVALLSDTEWKIYKSLLVKKLTEKNVPSNEKFNWKGMVQNIDDEYAKEEGTKQK